jgi:methionyl-tRNA synthetase
MDKFYITTTLPYVNADPHIGFAREIVQADVLARFRRLRDDEVFFNTGTDEHGLKNFRIAREQGLSPEEYCDKEVKKWQGLKEILNLSFDNFIRTTDKHHREAAQEFWRKCKAAGFIEKKKYKIKYCVGCELEKTDSELADGKCPIHRNLEIETIEEENYFFFFSKFQKQLLEFYEKNPDFVYPSKKLNEIKKFVEAGLQDFSVSRLKSKMPWGIDVPGDSGHVMYVWFDALVNYISAIGWPDDLKKFNDWWPGYQIAGKDNLRQQSAMWQAMLMSVGLPVSRRVFINGFITVGGEKMSKSLGNAIKPEEIAGKFSRDGARYLLLTLGSFGEDADVTMERLIEKYNADLANGLGNLISRIAKLSLISNFPGLVRARPRAGQFSISNKISNSKFQFSKFFEELKFKEALDEIWEQIAWANKCIEEKKLWELVKENPEEGKKVLAELLGLISEVGQALESFMPETSQKIREILKTGICAPLFPRI